MMNERYNNTMILLNNNNNNKSSSIVSLLLLLFLQLFIVVVVVEPIASFEIITWKQQQQQYYYTVPTRILKLQQYPFSCHRSSIIGSSGRRHLPVQQQQQQHVLLSSSLLPSDVEVDNNNDNDNDNSNDEGFSTITNDNHHIHKLKQQLIIQCAMYDRGYGITSTTIRQHIDHIIQQIELYNTVNNIASSLVSSTTTSSSSSNNNNNNIRIQGIWRMIYTTAYDVLLLQSSPFFIPGPIHQIYHDEISKSNTNTNDGSTIITNVIDFIPRIQSILPQSIVPNTVIRVNVQTRTTNTPTTTTIQKNNNNRIGLLFESVEIVPIQLLGISSLVSNVLPPITINLPKLPTFGTTTSASSSSPGGYFDVTYLDNDLLIIRQNPNNIGGTNGLFCLVRTNSIDE